MSVSLICCDLNNLELDFFFIFFFKNFLFILIKWKCEIIIIIYIVMILLLVVDFMTYRRKYKDDDKPLSIIERWIFVGLLWWYLYIKYYKWYDYIFNFNRRMRRRRRRRQANKKNEEKKHENEQLKGVKKRRSLTKKEYYDIYVLGAFLGAAAVALINFLINGG